MHERRTPAQERALVASAVAGDLTAWHAVVEGYSGLIWSLICRYLPHPDEDERRGVYVEVLESLHAGSLAEFDARSRLSTWIGVVTRSRCLDHLRSRRGRKQIPRWLAGLSELDQRIYQLYFLQGHSFDRICGEDLGNGEPFSVDSLLESLDRIEAHLDRGVRRRLAFELHARSSSSVPGRLLEYLVWARQEGEQEREKQRADRGVLERETRELLTRVTEAMGHLEAEEQEVLALRFEQGMTAKKIADVLGLTGQRRVYTILERALRRLKGILDV